jgi:hypothetical protein
MSRRPFSLLGLLLAWLALSGHVGSPNIFFDGHAGPYPLRVVVRPPGVIPGQAEITVRVLGDGVTAVGVQPVRWNLGVEGAPRPDPAALVQGETRLWAAQLWLMEFGSYSVRVVVDGTRGEHAVIVPVRAIATERLGMPAGLAIALTGLGLFLLVGALTIVGAAAREASLPPGEQPGARQRRRVWIARGVALPVLALALLGGSRWWDAEDAAYLENMYEPLEVASSVEAGPSGRVFTLRITDPGWATQQWSPLVPDHGKLMHMFLVREPALDVIAHLHPVRVDSATFRQLLPPLPAGRYRVYADVVHESGFTQTLVDHVDVPAAGETTGGAAALDADDSWLVSPLVQGSVAMLDDGSTMTWERPAALAAGTETELRFTVRGPDGRPARLEAYMGMQSHAVISRDDGAVFVHLHPMGTVSMASQQLFEQRARGDTLRDASGALLLRDAHGAHASHADHDATLAFPYEFPQPGRYRVWVQVKREGRVLTGAFDAEVAAR